jgi:hypothetical protein
MRRAHQFVVDFVCMSALWLCAWLMGDVTWPAAQSRGNRVLSCLIAVGMGLGFAAALAHGLDVL